MIKILNKNKLKKIFESNYIHIKGGILKRIEKEIKKLKNKKKAEFINFKKQLIFLRDNLDFFIIGEIDEILNFTSRENCFQNFLYDKKASYLGKKTKLTYGSKMIYLLGYDSWRGIFSIELMQKLKVKVCPYCNEHYTYLINTSGKSKILAQFDHFLPSSTHPYLSMSFFNLIPSCGVCNHNKLKYEFLFLKVNPYLQDKNLLKFSYRFSGEREKCEEIFLKIDDNFNDGEKRKIYDFYDKLLIKERYNQHLDIANEISEVSNGNTFDYFFDMHNKFGVSYEEIYKILYGNFFSEIEFVKRPLSKFMRDLIEELNPDFIEEIKKEMNLI